MNVFQEYATFYDSLYQNDYQGECNFIKSIFRDYSGKEINSILDLGCGTGSHALIFADMGYAVTGVDSSESMLKVAREKAASQKKDIPFLWQDIRHLELPRKFDSAVAMTTVMGYQTTNNDVEDTLISVNRCLEPEGLFVFDAWFGPALLMEKPVDKIKTIESAGKRLIQYSHPVLDIVNNTVEMDYRLLELTDSKLEKEVTESHRMRFFFYHELKYFLTKNGFELMLICPFMQRDRELDKNCWNISVIARKTG